MYNYKLPEVQNTICKSHIVSTFKISSRSYYINVFKNFIFYRVEHAINYLLFN